MNLSDEVTNYQQTFTHCPSIGNKNGGGMIKGNDKYAVPKIHRKPFNYV